jgi:prolyl oligopeptidase
MENPSWLSLSLVAPIRLHLVSATVVLGMFAASETVAQRPQAPPIAPVRVVTEVYFGTKISDPYRYMENLKDPEVVKWFSEQDAYTRLVLSRIPGREALLKRIQQLDESGPPRVFDFQRYQNQRYFYQKRLANENIAKLYMRTGLQGSEKLILDPDRYSTKSDEHYTLNYYVPSLDGRFVAYGVSPSGSEDAVIHVLDLTTGKDTDESIDRSWYGGISWLPDGQSFFHVRFQKLPPGADPAERRLKSRVFLHKVGGDPERDLPVFGFGVNSGIDLDPADSCGVVSDPRIPYALVYVNHGFNNDLTIYTAPLESVGKASTKWQKIIDVDDGVVNFDVRGDDLYLITHKDAPRFKVIQVSLSHPDLANAQAVVPGGEPVITNVAAMADALYIQELDGGIGKLLRLAYSGKKAQRVSLPFDGSFGMAGGDPRLA